MRILSLGRRIVSGVTYSPDGRFLISVNSRFEIRFWALPAGEQRYSFELAHLTAPLFDDSFHHCGTFGIHGHWLNFRHGVWDLRAALDYVSVVETGVRLERPFIEFSLKGPENDHLLGMTTNGDVFAGVTQENLASDPRIGIWDQTGRLRRQFRIAKSTHPHSPVLSSDGRMVAGMTSAPNEYMARRVVLFDVASGELRADFEHTNEVSGAAFSPDGRLLATAAGRCVRLWDVESSRELKRFPAFSRYAASLAFSPDGRLLAAGSRDGEVRLWDTASLREVTRLDWRIGEVLGLAFSPDGQTAAAAGRRGKIVVWDLD